MQMRVSGNARRAKPDRTFSPWARPVWVLTAES